MLVIHIITACAVGIRHRRLARPSERVSSAPDGSSSTSRSASSSGIVAGLVGKRLFNFAWTKIDDEDPPKGTTEYAPWVKILGAAALQGVIFKVTRVVVDRYGAIGLDLSHWFVAGREASGPGRRRMIEAALAVVGERVLEAREVPLQQELQRAGRASHALAAAGRRRAAAAGSGSPGGGPPRR